MLNFPIQKEESDQTLISFLKKRFKTTPLTLIYKLLRNKKIKINGKNIRYYHYRLKTGEEITIYDNSLQVSTPNIQTPPQTEINFSIIYEDKNILIILKEHRTSMPELDAAARYYFYQQNPLEYQRLSQKYFSFTAIHRLDKLAKGLVIYPKNSEAKRVLYKAISDKDKIEKKYLAVCENISQKPLPNCISGYSWKNEEEKRMEFGYEKNNSTAKYCSLEIKKIRQINNHQLLEITLQTGRKHQIRSILSFLGCPILGDKKYNSKVVIKNKICLVAYKITLINLPSPLDYLNNKIFQVKDKIKNIKNNYNNSDFLIYIR